MSKLFAGAGYIALILLITLFNTWVLSELWGWYITPVFAIAVPKLYLLYGLVLFAALMTNSAGKSNETLSYSNIAARGVAKGISCLVIGWAVQAAFA